MNIPVPSPKKNEENAKYPRIKQSIVPTIEIIPSICP
jgi:hypothetical protein